MQTAPEGTGTPTAFSKAFDNFVKDDDDVIGLLGYALYKKAVREAAGQGLLPSPGNTRNPSPTEVRTYRESAERRVDGLVTASLEMATPGLQQSSMLDALATSEAAIKNHVTDRTSFVPTMFMNLAAWAITLVLTFLILVLASRPDLVTFFRGKADNAAVQTEHAKPQ